jgi:hypothetical protein
MDTIENLGIDALGELADSLSVIPDKRFQPYVEHKLIDIVMLTLLAVLTNANEWGEIAAFAVAKEAWLRKILELPNGIPSHDTIQRVISSLDSDYVYSLCLQFLQKKLSELENSLPPDEFEPQRDIIPIDGKTSRGSRRSKTDKEAVKAMHTVSAFSTENGFAIGQVAVEEKTNEIPATRELLRMIDVQNAVVTWDALNTQRETVAIVIHKKGDYVAALKKNQHSFYEDVELYF